MLPDIDDPIQLSALTSSSSVPEPSADQIGLLADMGFTHAQARKALLETVRSPTLPLRVKLVDAARRAGILNVRSSGCSIIPMTPAR